jgi:hypothetical protein
LDFAGKASLSTILTLFRVLFVLARVEAAVAKAAAARFMRDGSSTTENFETVEQPRKINIP